MSEYARLGSACTYNGDSILNNTKYFPFAPGKTHLYTDMYQYPGQSYDFVTNIGMVDRVEDVKDAGSKIHPHQHPSEHPHISTPFTDQGFAHDNAEEAGCSTCTTCST